MKIEIKSWWTGNVLIEVEADSIRAALEIAVGKKTDLRGADLGGADLRGAHLRDADLRDADLRDADLRDADLRDADLRGAHLRDADLRGAHLRDADLRGARLETGETMAQYIESVVPALCTAGGRTIEEVATAWNCHDWGNCPMHVAFNGAESPDDPRVPMLLRPRVHQFVRLFDARLLPNPLGEKASPACPVTPGQ